MFSLVAEFHRAFGQIVATTPTLPDGDVRALRMRLLDEEFGELADAIEKRDVVEVADALADICYIACGTTDVYGIRPDDHTLPFHDAPGIPAFPGNVNRVYDARNAVRTAVAAVWQAESENDLHQLAAALQMTVNACFLVAAMFRIPLRDVFDEVHSSNMSKLGPDGKPIKREDGKFLKGPNYFKADIPSILNRHGTPQRAPDVE